MKQFVVVVSFLLSWQSFVAAEEVQFYQQPASALQWYNQAQQLESEGRYAEAVSAYNAVIQTPDATQQTCIACTWAHRGLCLERLGDYGNAAHSYTHALQYGDIPFAREGLGRIQARMQPQQQPNYGNVPPQQYQPSYQVEQRKSFCDEVPSSPFAQHQFYLRCQNSSLPPELADAIRQAGKKQQDEIIELLSPR